MIQASTVQKLMQYLHNLNDKIKIIKRLAVLLQKKRDITLAVFD